MLRFSASFGFIGGRAGNVLAGVLAFACGASLCGCNPGSGSRPVSLNIWQTNVQSYVQDHGNGDLNSLREVEITPGQPGFRAYSHDRPEQSKDVVGVLVGVVPRGEGGVESWYVYVVGSLDREQVTLIHLAAVRADADKFQWLMGQDSGGGTVAYLDQRKKNWQAHQADREPPRSALGFPSEEDQFSMQVAGDIVTVNESASGATWMLTFASPTN
jgi:hypothetical protein